jgi:hypothetical protein
MGSGDKFSIDIMEGWGFGIFFNTFPHQLSVHISLIKINIYMGFGKGYDER